MVINVAVQEQEPGVPRGPPCPSTFLGSPGRAGKEAEPPNNFISSRSFPDRWERIAIKKKKNLVPSRGKI